MAIDTDDLIDKFGAASVTEITDSVNISAVNAGAFSTAGATSDVTTWTNSENVREARLVIKLDFATNPVADEKCYFHMRRLNIQSTNDEEEPSANYDGAFVGSVEVAASTSDQWFVIDIPLVNVVASQEYDLYMYNDTSANTTALWQVWIMDITTGPAES